MPLLSRSRFTKLQHPPLLPDDEPRPRHLARVPRPDQGLRAEGAQDSPAAPRGLPRSYYGNREGHALSRAF